MPTYAYPVNYISLTLILGMVLSVFSCSSRKTFTEYGLSFVEIGDEMPEEGLRKWKGKSVKDSLFNADDFSWRSAILSYKNGPVYIEEDFLGNNSVNRIRIETQDLLYQDSISVGKSIQVLNSYPGKWFVAYLADYELWDISCDQFPSIHFLVEPIDKDKTSLSTPKLEDLNQNSPIVSIVIM